MSARVDLYWLPLGAGGWFVRSNGRIFEWLSAHRDHRQALALFHTGLVVRSGETSYAVEMGPVWNVPEANRGVVCEGPVGLRWLGRFRAFRYEVRCWPGGHIPDATEAVDSPQRLTEDPAMIAVLLAVLKDVPPLTWGRDELCAGDMWNSNSVVAWALARAGHDMDSIQVPLGGRAPGWRAGRILAQRQARLGPGLSASASLVSGSEVEGDSHARHELPGSVRR